MIQKTKTSKKSKSSANAEYVPDLGMENSEEFDVETQEESSEDFSPDELLPVLGNKPQDEEIDVLPLIPAVPIKAPTATSGDQLEHLKNYIKSISKYSLLGPEEERRLTILLHETGDVEVAKKLVLANLRLVIKIAMEYRHSYQNVMDLIQEGNIGLMKAVSKYNPYSGAKLSYYASWWIKSYILKFILDNFRLVKIGTTQEQKKLFYNLMREKERLTSQGLLADVKTIAKNLKVSEKSVVEMDQRLASSGAEISIDHGPSDMSETSFHEILPAPGEEIDEQLAFSQGLEILKEHLGSFLQGLNTRDREVFEKRLLSEIPSSLQSIADEYGVSRERIRQVEVRLLEKLKVYMSDYLR